MDSQNQQICTLQKNWIQSLKRHSTLISAESGEVQRINLWNDKRDNRTTIILHNSLFSDVERRCSDCNSLSLLTSSKDIK